jgi:hypothetical protein
MSSGGEEMAGSKEGFAEVAGDYFFWIADGGEVDAGAPVEEYIDVRRYTMELSLGEHSRLLVAALPEMTRREEGLEQFGDAGGLHGEVQL